MRLISDGNIATTLQALPAVLLILSLPDGACAREALFPASGQVAPPYGYLNAPRAAGPAAAAPGRVPLAPIDRAAAAQAFRIDPSYHSRRPTQAQVRIVGAFRLALPGRGHVVAAYALSFLPVMVRADTGGCFTVSADYFGGALSNGAAVPVDCEVLNRAAGRQTGAAPRPGLRFVNSSWGYDAWADDRTGRTLVTTTRGGVTETILSVDMAIVGMYAMSSPDSPYSDISFVGKLDRQDTFVTVGLSF